MAEEGDDHRLVNERGAITEAVAERPPGHGEGKEDDLEGNGATLGREIREEDWVPPSSVSRSPSGDRWQSAHPFRVFGSRKRGHYASDELCQHEGAEVFEVHAAGLDEFPERYQGERKFYCGLVYEFWILFDGKIDAQHLRC